jgi:hypothetical protein
MRSFGILTLHKVLLWLTNRDDGTGWACSKHKTDDNCIQFLLENLKVRDHEKDMGVDGC